MGKIQPHYGAQFSPSMNVWIPIVYDGKNVSQLEPRRDREAAMDAARGHFHRIFYTEAPAKEWTPPETKTK